MQGEFCGDCLFMRYGENVDEVNARSDWVCPHCRDATLCNCSQHRTRLGWGPTGALYRRATGEGALSPPASRHSVGVQCSSSAACICLFVNSTHCEIS